MAPPPIPALRGDVDIRERGDGLVELRDPRLLQILTVSREDYEVVRLFDGARGAEAVRAELLPNRDISAREVKDVAREFSDLHLLDTPEARRAKPQTENVAPPSLLGGRKGLEVLPEVQPGARWACHGCGACCRGLLVELTPEEDARIDRSLYGDVLGALDYAEEQFLTPTEPAKRVLRHKALDDDRCVFLAPDGRCTIHARQGPRAKPNACQMFPFLVVQVPRRPPRFGVRVNCLSMYKSWADGPPLAQHTEEAFELFRRLEVHQAPRRVELFAAEVSFPVYDRLVDQIQEGFRGGVTPKRLADVDRLLLRGRVRRSRRRYGKNVLQYLAQELRSPLPTELGAYAQRLAQVRRAEAALKKLALGLPPPEPSPTIAAFLRQQLDHALWLCGPLNAPDAGYGLVALMLALEATLHVVGARNELQLANSAFDAFSSPLLETLEHFWPVLRAIDAPYAKRIEEEMK